jgi:phage baseplate assembly protein W
MSTTLTERLGVDLAVVLGPPGMAAHDASSLDLQLVAGTSDPSADGPRTLSLRENVAQALILRLLTPVGALAPLGHAGYGSRLHELIGRHRDDAARALCKAYVLQAVADEPRVESTAVEFGFEPSSEGPSELRFVLVVQPVDGSDPVSVGLQVAL